MTGLVRTITAPPRNDLRERGVVVSMHLDLYTSSFCAPCAAARRVVADAVRVVPGLTVQEIDVAAVPDAVEALGIRSTPTILVSTADGVEVFRSPGVPRSDQLLAALALAL